jgi:hypothetical protein
MIWNIPGRLRGSRSPRNYMCPPGSSAADYDYHRRHSILGYQAPASYAACTHQ